MKIFTFIFLALIGSHQTYAQDIPSPGEICTKILHHHWKNYGYSDTKNCPRIGVSEGEVKGAAYQLEKGNTAWITIDKKAYNLCMKYAINKDTAMLYFIIGHELGHHFQHQNNKNATTIQCLLSHGRAIGSKTTSERERQADHFAALSTYLLTNSLTQILPNFFEELYALYGIPPEPNNNYPGLAYRKQAAEKVQEALQEMIGLYETAPLLSAGGYFAEADGIYEHLVSVYQGKEFWYNRAVNKMQEALNFTAYNNEPYAYPLEWDYRHRLQKERSMSGGMGTKEEEKFDQLLSAAALYLNKAKDIDSTSTKINLCLMTLQTIRANASDLRVLQQTIENHEWDLKTRYERDWFKLNQATYLAKSGRLGEAKSIFIELQTSHAPHFRAITEHNDSITDLGLKFTPLPVQKHAQLSSVSLSCSRYSGKHRPSEQYSVFDFNQSSVGELKQFNYYNSQTKNKLTLEQLPLRQERAWQATYDGLPASGKQQKLRCFSLNEQQKICFQADDSGKLTGVFKICEH